MKKICEKIFLFTIPALFAFPLFKPGISSMLFIILSINTLIYSIISKSYKQFDFKILYLTIPFWIAIVFSFIRFDGFQSLKPINHTFFYLYFTILKNSCLLIAIGFIAAFLYKYDCKDFFVYRYDIPKFRDFIYNEITFFKIHPTYYTTIVLFCTAFSLSKVLNQKKYYELVYVFSFVFITFLLLVKIIIILQLIVITYIILFYSNLNLRKKIVTIVVFICIAIVLIFTIPGIRNRFTEIYKSYNSNPNGLAYDSTNIRTSIVKCNFELAKEHYLLGVGYNNLQKELNNCFETNYDSSFYENHAYLTHNYFFYILLSTGIFGFIIYLFYCYKVYFELKKIKYFLLNIAIISILIVSFTEDFFYRHYGVLYFNLLLMSFLNYWKFSSSKILN
jgi:O-antigen ligase